MNNILLTASPYMGLYLLCGAVIVSLFAYRIKKGHAFQNSMQSILQRDYSGERDQRRRIIKHPLKVLIQARYISTYYSPGHSEVRRYVHQQLYYSTRVQEAESLGMLEEYKELAWFIEKYVEGFEMSYIEQLVGHVRALYPFIDFDSFATGSKDITAFASEVGRTPDEVRQLWEQRRIVFVMDRAVEYEESAPSRYFIPRTLFREVFSFDEAIAH